MKHFFGIAILVLISLLVLTSCFLTPAHDHDYVVYEMKEPTKTEAGYRKYKCSVCGETVKKSLGRLESAKWAGVRVSSYGMVKDPDENPYGFDEFPSVKKTLGFAQKMESCYSGSIGTYILLVGTVDENTWTCRLRFPLSKTITKASGTYFDFYEDYLSAMDAAGYSVWLQIEPGDADIVELATEVMSHYKHHSCVKGFGIDVEWYKPEDEEKEGYGTKLDQETATDVLDAVKAIKENYTVFVKHWDKNWLPKINKTGLIYVDDSQGFHSGKTSTALERMCNEFASWADNFSPCPVMFQIGYENDMDRIWGSMQNPAKEVGEAILAECKKRGLTNDIGIIWVDFTLKEVIGKID